jgi:hypothetical protein
MVSSAKFGPRKIPILNFVMKASSSSALQLFMSFGLLNYFFPLFPLLHPLFPVLYSHLSQVISRVVFPF